MTTQTPTGFSDPNNWRRAIAALGLALSSRAKGGTLSEGFAQGAANFDAGEEQKRQQERQKRQDELAEEEIARRQAADARKAASAERLQAILMPQELEGLPVRQIGDVPGRMAGAGPKPAADDPFASLNLSPTTRRLLAQQAADDPDGVMGLLLEQSMAGPDSGPASVQEYEYAKQQGYTGSYLEFQLEQKKAGASTTKLDVHAPTQPMIGTIPPGYVVKPDGKGGYLMELIPGGPPATEAQKEADKKAGVASQQERMSDIVTQDIARVLDVVGKSPKTTTGIGGQVLSNIGGTAANDARALVQTIKSNVGFDQLQQMRNNSPTGGALGPVSDAENALLQSVMGNLEQSQSQEQLEYNLKRLNNVILDIVDGPGNGDRYDLGKSKGSDLKSKYGLE